MKKRQPLIITTALLAILMVCSLSGWAQLGKIHGTLKNGKEVMPYEKVELWRDGRTTGKGTLTDENGKFEFAMLDAGSYSIKVNTTSGTVVQNVNLESGESEPIICQVSRDEENGPETRVKGLEFLGSSKEVFSVDPKITFTMTRKEIEQFGGGRDIKAMAALSPAMVQADAGDPLNFKGGRSDANATYIDGLKLRGTDQMPLAAIEQMTVITGGLPAEYGDVTGAVIVITTRNPGMIMGHLGPKPLTKVERQQQKQLRKNAGKQGAVDQTPNSLVYN